MDKRVDDYNKICYSVILFEYTYGRDGTTANSARLNGVSGKNKIKWGAGEVKTHIAFLTMLLPGFLYLLIFDYLPMPGIIMAFKNFKLAMPPAGYWTNNPFIYGLFIENPWVGFENFRFLFTTPDVGIIFRNTLLYNITFMTVGLIFSIGLAVIVNELRQRFMAKLYHTFMFLPYFISWVIVSYIVYAIFSPKSGFVPGTMRQLGLDPVNAYNEPFYWPFIFVFSDMWKYTGYGSIIYMATMAGFDQQLYEAAAIDGANKWQQMWKITLPQLIPTIVILQILALGRILTSNFDMFYTMPLGSGPLRSVSLTIDVYVYSTMRSGARLSLAAAAGLFQSFFGFVLILGTNLIARRIEKDVALF